MTTELPLFPLHTVFFPRMLMPLIIFEERYQALMRHCVEHEHDFGIVLIRSGQEVEGPAEPYEIGTTAHIMRLVDLEDDRKHAVVQGTDRFVIRELLHDRPYLVGMVDEYPLEAGGLDNQLLARVEITFYRYLQLLKDAQGLTIEISNLPDDPEGIAWMIAWGLQVDLPHRQELLSTRSLQELLQQEKRLLDNENRILEILDSDAVKRRLPPESMGAISLN